MDQDILGGNAATKALAALFILAAITLLSISAVTNSIIETTRMNASIRVGDYVGINLNTDKLNFGTVMPGGYAERSITLDTGNMSFKEAYIMVTAEPGFEEWLAVSSSSPKSITKSEKKNVKFYATPPTDAKPMDVEFAITVYLMKRKPGILDEIVLGERVREAEDSMVVVPRVSINITRPDERWVI